MGTTQLGQLCWPWPSACCCSSKSAAGLAAARKKRKRRRKVDHTGSASFFSSESSNAPSGLGISASSPDVSATEASFSSKSFNVSLLVASLPIDSLRSMNSLLKNSQDDRNNYRAINASYEIVKHDSHAAVEILQPVRRIRLNNVKKAKKYKRKNDCADGPPPEECQRKQGDHLTGDFIDNDFARIFSTRHLLDPRTGPYSHERNRENRNNDHQRIHTRQQQKQSHAN